MLLILWCLMKLVVILNLLILEDGCKPDQIMRCSHGKPRGFTRKQDKKDPTCTNRQLYFFVLFSFNFEG